MNHWEFPRWSGPFVGMVAGVICALRAGWNGPIPMAALLIGGMAIGGLAGSVILLLDPKAPEAVPDLPDQFQRPVTERPSGVVGRFLAIAGVLLCWTPFLGLVLNGVGWLVNRRSSDWALTASMAGTWIGAAITLWMVAALLLGW